MLSSTLVMYTFRFLWQKIEFYHDDVWLGIAKNVYYRERERDERKKKVEQKVIKWLLNFLTAIFFSHFSKWEPFHVRSSNFRKKFMTFL